MTANEYIVTCRCPEMPKFAQESYSLLYPDKQTPELVSGASYIRQLANKYLESEFYDYLIGLARSKEKFAYLFNVTESGEINASINLKTGARVQ